MGRRGLFAVTLALFVVVGTGAGISSGMVSGQDSSQGYEEPHAACGEIDGASLAVLLEDGTVKTDAVALHSGMAVRIVFCDGNSAVPTDAWTLESTDGLEIDDSATSAWLATSTSTGESVTIELMDHVSGPDADRIDDVTVSIAGIDEVPVAALEDHEGVRFVDGERIERFQSASEDYDDDVSEIRQLLEALETDDIGDETVATVRALETEHAELEKTRAERDAVLHEAAYEGNDDAARALVAYRAHDEALRTDVESAVESIEADAEDQALTSRFVIAGALLGPLVAMLAAGWVGGRRLANRDLQAVTRNRRRNTAYDYRLTQLWKPFLVAGLLLVGAVVALVVTGTIQDLLQVIR